MQLTTVVNYVLDKNVQLWTEMDTVLQHCTNQKLKLSNSPTNCYIKKFPKQTQKWVGSQNFTIHDAKQPNGLLFIFCLYIIFDSECTLELLLPIVKLLTFLQFLEFSVHFSSLMLTLVDFTNYLWLGVKWEIKVQISAPIGAPQGTFYR
jgi:hypothetical protein